MHGVFHFCPSIEIDYPENTIIAFETKQQAQDFQLKTFIDVGWVDVVEGGWRFSEATYDEKGLLIDDVLDTLEPMDFFHVYEIKTAN